MDGPTKINDVIIFALLVVISGNKKETHTHTNKRRKKKTMKKDYDLNIGFYKLILAIILGACHTIPNPIRYLRGKSTLGSDNIEASLAILATTVFN